MIHIIFYYVFFFDISSTIRAAWSCWRILEKGKKSNIGRRFDFSFWKSLDAVYGGSYSSMATVVVAHRNLLRKMRRLYYWRKGYVHIFLAFTRSASTRKKDITVTEFYYAELLVRFYAELQKNGPIWRRKKCPLTMTTHASQLSRRRGQI